jgi:hypothetical protein
LDVAKLGIGLKTNNTYNNVIAAVAKITMVNGNANVGPGNHGPDENV